MSPTRNELQEAQALPARQPLLEIEHRETPTLRYAVPVEVFEHTYRRQGFRAVRYEDGSEYIAPAQREKLEAEAEEAKAAIEEAKEHPREAHKH